MTSPHTSTRGYDAAEQCSEGSVYTSETRHIIPFTPCREINYTYRRLIDGQYSPDVQCDLETWRRPWCWDLFVENKRVFNILLLQLGFSRVSRVSVRLSFSDKAGVGLPDVQ